MYANISSMNTHSRYLNINANNIANVNTNDKNLPFSQTDLTKEIPEQILIGYGFEANAISFKTYDEMMGTVIDLKT